jgi:hypothetical protein
MPPPKEIRAMSGNIAFLVVCFDWGAAWRHEAGAARETTGALVAKQAAKRLAARLIAGARS